MIKRSYAKINLAINIIKKNEDGYHELDMIMTKINLYDKMYFSLLKSNKIIITCTNPFVPCDNKNLVYKMASLVKEKYNIKEGIKIHIVKNIPVQAGLGGGSSNAACSLEAMNKLFKLNMSYQEKLNLSKKLGSDIAFFYQDGICRARGLGDKLEFITNKYPSMYIILLKPLKGNSTKQVYKNVDLNNIVHPNIDLLIEAIKNNNYNDIVKYMDNSLETSAISIRPIIKDMMLELKDLGIDKSIVCGSGSTILAVTNKFKIVKKVKNAYLNKKTFVYITKMI